MKPLFPVRQTPGLCGPATLKIMLQHHDKEYSEDELAKLCEVTPNTATTHEKIIQGAKTVGGLVDAKSGASLDDLRGYIESEIPVMVGWSDDKGDHYGVVYEIGKLKVFMMDPETESGIRIMPIPDFVAAWHDTHAGTRTEHWMMAITNFKG
ncbi:MAG TPA: cysteine peptidase family C39 domain-containing protein [Verrucomicrobiae bacterium]|nr:cysteine peptidase family C39 domain-containing protein [Verrucomicrobiae bacterium]